MSPKAQRIAIAKSVGIYLHDGDHAPSNYTFVSDLPDYLNDLNAMHEAEKIFDDAIYCRYINELCTLTINDNNSMYMATAKQRAEAYLRTIGKWEGGADE